MFKLLKGLLVLFLAAASLAVSGFGLALLAQEVRMRTRRYIVSGEEDFHL